MAIQKQKTAAECVMLRPGMLAYLYWKCRNEDNLTKVEQRYKGEILQGIANSLRLLIDSLAGSKVI